MDAGGVTRKSYFTVWKSVLALFDGFLGVCLLFMTMVGCLGSVFVVVCLLVLSGDGLAMHGILSVLDLHGLGMFELQVSFVLGCGMIL